MRKWAFFFFSVAALFFITAEYAITRPISYSVFVSHFSSKWIPYAWLATIPLNLLIVSLYNRFVSRFGCAKMLALTTLAAALVNTASGYALSVSKPLAFFLFMWKDVYVLLFFQQVWSVIHATAEAKRAKYLYGLIFGLGGLGGIAGSMVPGFLALKMGSATLLFLTLPLLFGFYLAGRAMLAARGGAVSLEKKEARGGFTLIRQSRYLQYILWVVVFMQVTSAVIDFQFTAFLEHKIPEQDARTAFSGKFFGLISTVKIGFQLVGTWLLVHFLGLRRSHFIIPFVLLGNAVAMLFFPLFSVVTFAFGTIKSFEYSFFNIIKEMLYIPLGNEEKFKAKAVIDIFAYRSSRGFASLFIIGLQAFHIQPISSWISAAAVLLLTAWLVTVTLLYKQEERGLHVQTR